MNTVETITAAIAELPPEDVARIRTWLDGRAQDESDAPSGDRRPPHTSQPLR
jgi:hypothetical protein